MSVSSLSGYPYNPTPVHSPLPQSVKKDDGDHDNDATESKTAAAAETSGGRVLDVKA
jgi:hypothetical protein